MQTKEDCGLQLVLAEILKLLADAARLRTQHEHRRRVLLAFTTLRPILARFLLIEAHLRANLASLGAVAHHRRRIGLTLRLSPDHALRHVGVHADIGRANIATVRASLQDKAGVLMAAAISSPAGAVAVSAEHVSLHTPQETGQCLSMNSGLSPQEPALVQLLHSSWASLQVGVHSAHEVGHALNMKRGLLWQFPAFAQLPHETSVSLHS
eukprot:CAMPEP_0119377296 /NCGR_PEP_ID=MMETSP1334-20130426/44126_1 /TAXON_ID=127549 /ORGANISM="Calcidiscus leptoporus, Strain RCC1130" /LENGTH=209 /DNA_ID=CAMNT_0007396149 /DNA_START=363 /DNA_END=994 /DNA_ORIENTATION=+